MEELHVSQSEAVQAGVIATDKEADDGDEVLVIDVSEAPCDDEDEAFVTWDWKMNPVTVADENEQYGYDPEQPFAIVSFVTHLDRKWPNWKSKELEFLEAKLEEDDLKTYKYPVERLNVKRRQF